MREISTEADFRSPLDPYDEVFLKKPSEDWEVLARMAFVLTIFISLSAYIPAALKKNRTYAVGPLPNLGPSIPQLAQVIQPPREEVVVAQVGYACTQKDRTKIVQLFTGIADATTWDLIWRGLELKKLGNEIEHVHPLALLACAPKYKMHEILTSRNPIKIKPFMDNITQALSQEHNKGNLVAHIEAFAREVQKDKAQIRQWIQALDWSNLVYYLFDVRA